MTSDAGLILVRELDERLGLDRIITEHLTDCRQGLNTQFYQGGTWMQPRRIVAKVEHHAGELFPRVGFIVTDLRVSSRAVLRFYNNRDTAEQWMKVRGNKRRIGRDDRITGSEPARSDCS